MAIAKVLTDVPMGLGLPGLMSLAKSKGLKFGEGQYLMFMNRKRTKLKVLFDDQTILCFAKDSGEFTIEELGAIPSRISKRWFSPEIESVLSRVLTRRITPISSLVGAA